MIIIMKCIEGGGVTDISNENYHYTVDNAILGKMSF